MGRVLLRSVVRCGLLVRPRKKTTRDFESSLRSRENENSLLGPVFSPYLVFSLFRSCQTLDPRPVTPLFAIHQSLITSHRSSPAERNWHREAILACVSRLAKAKPLLAAGCSSRQEPSFRRTANGGRLLKKWSPYFLTQVFSRLRVNDTCVLNEEVYLWIEN